MDVYVKPGGIQAADADAIVVNLFEGVLQPCGSTGALDQVLDGAIQDMIAAGELRGRLNETVIFHPRGAIPSRHVIVVGLGKPSALCLDSVRQAAAAAARAARKVGARTLASIVHGAGAGRLKVADAAQAVVEGTILGLYRYAAPRGNLDETALHSVESFTLIEFDQSRLPEVEAGARIGHIVAGAACMARDLDNQPSNVMTPTALADVAQAIAADFGMACEVMGAEQMGELKMGALLGVSRGASQPPRFIVLEHNPGVDAGAGPFVLVGKGITFDSGGISIKPSSGMEQMRGDMSGAAAALASMQAIGAIGLRGHVVALVPATENMPGGNAIHPGDVVTAMNGLSIEVVDTDAEGRLVLADALAYAQRYRPAFVVDIATLTGAIATALGHHMTGVYANEDALWSAIQTAGEAAGELMWRMPLDPVFDVQIETPFADVKNYGGSPGGSATGASFLAKFIGDHAWAHLDIGSTDWWEADQVYTKKPYFVRGCTGVGVGTLVGLLRAWEAGHLSRHR